jgi:hypothetical protein
MKGDWDKEGLNAVAGDDQSVGARKVQPFFKQCGGWCG